MGDMAHDSTTSDGGRMPQLSRLSYEALKDMASKSERLSKVSSCSQLPGLLDGVLSTAQPKARADDAMAPTPAAQQCGVAASKSWRHLFQVRALCACVCLFTGLTGFTCTPSRAIKEPAPPVSGACPLCVHRPFCVWCSRLHAPAHQAGTLCEEAIRPGTGSSQHTQITEACTSSAKYSTLFWLIPRCTH